jgi:acetylornithine deacetylase/succinyl-diaminopimelate desuccinylase-like protein
MATVLAGVLTFSASSLLAQERDASREPRWDTVTREAAELLRDLIRIPSVYPPGNELPAARYVADRLRASGLEVTLVESSPGRGNVMARLAGDGSKRPILLLCHLDVVDTAEGWSVNPFAGTVKDGSIYGRGAIDDKGMCISNLVAFLELRRQKVPLSRDVVFLATADEEGSGSGAEFMLERFPGELDVEYVLNEGGAGVVGVVKERQVVFAIAAGDKGLARLHVVARGKPGHPAFPAGDHAPERLAAALARLAAFEGPLVFHDYMEPFFDRMGKSEGGLRGFVMQHPGPLRGLLLRSFASSPQTRATVSNTCALTRIRAGESDTTIPGLAEAWLDCRLLPGTELAAWEHALQSAVAEFGVDVTRLGGWPGSTSPWDTEFSRALEAQLSDGLDDCVVVPMMGAPWTDSRFFRARGAVAYGIFPFVMTQDELATIHGDDERLRVSELGLGVRRTYRVLLDMAGESELSLVGN